MSRLSVLIVDDSGLYRRILSEAVTNAAADSEVLLAENGLQALEILAAKRADACLLDVNMPVMDGLETLKRVKLSHPQLPVIMVSGDSKDGPALTVQALRLGALDFITKPLDQDFEANMLLMSSHLKALFDHIRRQGGRRAPQSPARAGRRGAPAGTRPADLVVIASSTGGPVALEKVVPKLDAGFPKPILVVQHMPPDFTKAFSESLDRKSRIAVREAKEGDGIVPGRVLIAPGGYHMKVKRISASEQRIRLEKSEPVCGVRPSADVLFASAASAYENMNVLAVVLTGMGKDGTDGVAALKEKTSCRCITQSERSCVVYGMPWSVCESGLSDGVFDIEEIAEQITLNASQELK